MNRPSSTCPRFCRPERNPCLHKRRPTASSCRYAVGASLGGLTPAAWNSLRTFWTLYFREAGAELFVFGRVQRGKRIIVVRRGFKNVSRCSCPRADACGRNRFSCFWPLSTACSQRDDTNRHLSRYWCNGFYFVAANMAKRYDSTSRRGAER